MLACHHTNRLMALTLNMIHAHLTPVLEVSSILAQGSCISCQFTIFPSRRTLVRVANLIPSADLGTYTRFKTLVLDLKFVFAPFLILSLIGLTVRFTSQKSNDAQTPSHSNNMLDSCHEVHVQVHDAYHQSQRMPYASHDHSHQVASHTLQE